jgi:tetratricopeptide (TPR) repeat protein
MEANEYASRRRRPSIEAFFVLVVACSVISQVSAANGQDDRREGFQNSSVEHAVPQPALEQTEPAIKDLAYANFNMARALELQRSNLPYARELAAKSVKQIGEISGADSPAYGKCLALLGTMDAKLYRFSDAIDELQSARPIANRNKDQFDFRNLIAVEVHLAWALRRNGDMKAAEHLYDDILKEYHRESRLRDAEYPIVLLAKAGMYMDMDKSEAAFNYITDAQEAFRRLSGECESQKWGIDAYLGRYFYIKKLYPESNAHFQKAVANLLKSEQLDRPNYAEVICEYSASLIQQEEYEEAEKVLSDRTADIEMCLGDDHPLVREMRDRRKSAQKLRESTSTNRNGREHAVASEPN